VREKLLKVYKFQTYDENGNVKDRWQYERHGDSWVELELGGWVIGHARRGEHCPRSRSSIERTAYVYHGFMFARSERSRRSRSRGHCGRGAHPRLRPPRGRDRKWRAFRGVEDRVLRSRRLDSSRAGGERDRRSRGEHDVAGTVARMTWVVRPLPRAICERRHRDRVLARDRSDAAAGRSETRARAVVADPERAPAERRSARHDRGPQARMARGERCPRASTDRPRDRARVFDRALAGPERDTRAHDVVRRDRRGRASGAALRITSGGLAESPILPGRSSRGRPCSRAVEFSGQSLLALLVDLAERTGSGVVARRAGRLHWVASGRPVSGRTLLTDAAGELSDACARPAPRRIAREYAEERAGVPWEYARPPRAWHVAETRGDSMIEEVSYGDRCDALSP
jgi:hypothetical protein